MTLIFLCLAWVLGIVAGPALPPGVRMPLVVSGAALLAAAVGARARRGLHRPALVVAACALGWARVAMLPPAGGAGSPAALHGSTVTLRGWVAAPPDVRATYTQLTLQATGAVGSEGARPVHGRVLLQVPHYPAYEYGDELRVTGALEEPPVLEGFDYRAYLAARGIPSLVRRAEVVPEGRRPGAWVALVRRALGVKARLRGVTESILPGAEAGLLSGILLGLDHTLPGDLDDAFRRVGLTHIIVISGYNIAMVAQLLLLSGAILRRTWAVAVALVGVALYGAFVGLDPPVARAVLMGAVWLGGPLVGRRSHSPTSLALATVVMTAANPRQLGDVSFQLSFASTMGLLLLEPVLARGLLAWAERAPEEPRRGRIVRVVRDVLLVTVAAQLATLPVVWHHFRELSLVALLANILVLWSQPAILVAGAAATALGALHLGVGRAAVWVAWPSLRYTVWVVETLARLPWASRPVPELPGGAVAAFYALLALPVLAAGRRPRGATPPPDDGAPPSPALTPRREPPRPPSRAALPSLALATVLVWAAALSLPDGRWGIRFLDVGQGDAIVIRSPGGRTVLVDGGPDPVLLMGRLGRALPFWQRRVDLVVCTHPDADHLSGLLPVLAHRDVGAALESPLMGDSALAQEWRSRLVGRGIPVVTAARGVRVTIGEGELTVLHPPADPSPTMGPNAASTVLLLSVGEVTALLMADVNADVEAELLRAEPDLRGTLLKVAHHGGADATSGAFLGAVEPAAAVISVGADNRFGHPAPDVLGRLAEGGVPVWRTDRCGDVWALTDGERLWMGSARQCEVW